MFPYYGRLIIYGSLPTNTTVQRCLKPLIALFFIQDPLLPTCTSNSLFLFCMKYCENPVRGLPSRLIPQHLQRRFPPPHSAGIMLCHCSHYLHSLLIVHLICLAFSAQLWIIRKSHCTRFNQIFDHICHLLVSLTKKHTKHRIFFSFKGCHKKILTCMQHHLSCLCKMKWVVRKANDGNCQNELQPLSLIVSSLWILNSRAPRSDSCSVLSVLR